MSNIFFAGQGPAFNDNTFRVQDNADATKELAFEISGVTTGTLRTLTIPDASGTIALEGASSEDTTLTSQTIDAGLTVVGDPAYLDVTTWKKATSTTRVPLGVFAGGTSIKRFGRLTGLAGLTAGTTVWLDSDGGLTNDSGDSATKVKIGFCESATILHVDLDVESNLLSEGSIILAAGNYHYIMESIPDSSTSQRSGINGGTTFALEGHFDSASATFVGLGFELYHIVTIGGSVDESFTLTGSSGAVGRTGANYDQRVAQRFVVATTGTLDSIAINVTSILDGTGATDVVMEIREGHTIESGTIVATSPPKDLPSTGVITYDVFS